tara:strand:+ start:204 stop:377 length:174 start_codon:yes stop_codon:yes gene_type:complete
LCRADAVIAEILKFLENPQTERTDEVLGRPAFDPQGSPVPDKSGNITASTYHRLSEN